MSFCTGVKEELCNLKYIKKPCCADAFLAGVLLFSQVFSREKIVLSSDCALLPERVVSFLKKLTGIEVSEITTHTRGGRLLYKITLTGQAVALVYEAAKVISLSADSGALKNKCDRVSFLRGAFCAAGYVSDPEVSYHLEISAPYGDLCALLSYLSDDLGVSLKTTARKGARTMLYIKDSEEIFAFLNMLGAASSSLRLMEAKVIKEVRNDINRKVNFETANLMKTASASAEQIEAIEKIQRERGLESLPAHLMEIAKIRLENPDLSLMELGKMLEPNLSRSGVNHRLKKIVEISKM